MDAAVLEQAKQGDADAFAVIYEQYHLAIHNYAYRLLGNQEQADDVTQESFIRAYQHLRELRDEAGLQAWLYRIASNICMDSLRRRRIISWLPLRHDNDDDEQHGSRNEQDAQVPPTPDFSIQYAESDLVHKALALLPPPLATCLVLRTVEGFSCEEIADILKIPRGTVWSRLARARELFVASYNQVSHELGGR